MQTVRQFFLTNKSHRILRDRAGAGEQRQEIREKRRLRWRSEKIERNKLSPPPFFWFFFFCKLSTVCFINEKIHGGACYERAKVPKTLEPTTWERFQQEEQKGKQKDP